MRRRRPGRAETAALLVREGASKTPSSSRSKAPATPAAMQAVAAAAFAVDGFPKPGMPIEDWAVHRRARLREALRG